jgi:hypothetical protein
VPRSRVRRRTAPRGRRARPCASWVRGPAMSKRIGPSMSTGPGWMAASRTAPFLLGGPDGRDRNDPSMLLSFERPAPAGPRGTRLQTRPTYAQASRRIRLFTVLENCTEATSAAIDKRRLKNGYHRALHDRRAPPALRKGCMGHQVLLGQITVKIVRAHGGCLGTKSRRRA